MNLKDNDNPLEEQMRGEKESQSHMYHYFSVEQRVPTDHPLRSIKDRADNVLKEMSGLFAKMYSHTGRPSIPPERLLKSMLLTALYSVRSDRLFCETLDYHILFRWFLDMNMDEPSFDASTFSKNRDRLLEHDVARKFFDAVVDYARVEGLLSDEHFTVDGTLIEAWASLKSFRPKDEKEPPTTDDDPGNPTVDFRGEKRSNKTHESRTDPDARLMRKGLGKEAKLSYSFNALMENRNGLCVDAALYPATGTAERKSAFEMLDRQEARGVKAKTLGADKGYHAGEFTSGLLARGIKPHIAMVKNRKTPGLDGRTKRSKGYKTSQRKRKRVEEIFGWMKAFGGFRKTRYRGRERVEEHGLIVAAAYNLLRISRLAPAPG